MFRIRAGILGLVLVACGDAARPEEPAAPDAALLRRFQALEAEVREIKALRAQVGKLQDEVAMLRRQSAAAATPPAATREPASNPGAPPPPGSPGAAGLSQPNQPRPTAGSTENRLPMQANYKYNYAGGFTQVADPDGEFTVNLQNQLIADGTFYDRSNLPTIEKNFNTPFSRVYLYGNVTKTWEYQVSVQESLGSFSLLDSFVNLHLDDRLQFKVGRLPTPFLYEFWAFFTAWDPVITNSLLLQLAGRRQIGAMAWGNVLDGRLQYQAGVFNGTPGAFFDLDHGVDFIGSATTTPFKRSGLPWLESLGGGASVESGDQRYLLSQGNTDNFIAGGGEPTLNATYLTSSGVPFFKYHDDVRAAGNRTRIAPHLFWFGRFSLLGEYLVESRTLADGHTSGTSVQRGFYVNASYWLTGERDKGDGLGGYTTISPLRPFQPRRGLWGPGAWQVAAQFSELNVGRGDFRRGFADPGTSTNRADQLMIGLNWWPNKFVRLSFDYVPTHFNAPIPLGGTRFGSGYDIFWSRLAMFF